MEGNKNKENKNISEAAYTQIPKTTTDLPSWHNINSNPSNLILSDNMFNNYNNNQIPSSKFVDHSKIAEFLKFTQKLKIEKRHSWPLGLNDARESVADHCYQLIIMVILYHDKLEQKVDLLKSIYMAAIHDLPEAICGDIPLTQQTDKIKQIKKENEMNAMDRICATLDETLGKSLFELYKEYERNECYEARFVRALDKIEAFQQHCEDPLDTWIHKEKVMVFQDKFIVDFCRFDSCLLSLAHKTKDDCIRKLKDAGEDLDMLRKDAEQC